MMRHGKAGNLESDFWDGCRVLVTGHTGFKGSWLSLWLYMLGAKVTGIALPPYSYPNLFKILNLESIIDSIFIDIREEKNLNHIVSECAPEIVIHMAAQSLVAKSYKNPIYTFSTNFMGTANLLQALRSCNNLKAILVITSDKVYMNDNSGRSFSEEDTLGGDDPYSASKAASELLVSSFASSYFDDMKIPLATARAGNVIGGGDWSEYRLIPDLWRGITNNIKVELRYPNATRPWQYVLEPLFGYLKYIEKMVNISVKDIPRTLNFGPIENHQLSVERVANLFLKKFGFSFDEICIHTGNINFEEKLALQVNANLANEILDWHPLLTSEETVEWTADWYRSYQKGIKMVDFSMTQINYYSKLIKK